MHARPPLWAWLALTIAVCAMSSGGVWFALLPDTPPVLRVAWRLGITSLLQMPGFVANWRAASPVIRIRWRGQLPLLIATGAVLAIHFATWSLSINMTSLADSLLFVSTTPLIIVAVTLIWYCCGRWMTPAANVDTTIPAEVAADSGPNIPPVPVEQQNSSANLTARADQSEQHSSGQSLTAWLRSLCDTVRRKAAGALPPTPLELLGTAVGFGATCVLAASASFVAPSPTDAGSGSGSSSPRADHEPSAGGDLVAFAGAVAMWLYLAVGSRLRQWMPLWMYALPVTGASAAFAAVASSALETQFAADGVGPTALFGWLGSGTRFGVAVAAAAGSGILGHTLANLSLQYINPLILSVALLLEPVVGSVFGWLAGVQGVPDAWTLGAGPVLLLGAVLTTLGSRDAGLACSAGRAKAPDAPLAEAMAATTVDASENTGSNSNSNVKEDSVLQ